MLLNIVSLTLLTPPGALKTWSFVGALAKHSSIRRLGKQFNMGTITYTMPTRRPTTSPQQWESFHPGRSSCLARIGETAVYYIQWGYLEHDERSLLETTINFRKRCTLPIKRDSSYCLGPITHPNVRIMVLSFPSWPGVEVLPHRQLLVFFSLVAIDLSSCLKKCVSRLNDKSNDGSTTLGEFSSS